MNDILEKMNGMLKTYLKNDLIEILHLFKSDVDVFWEFHIFEHTLELRSESTTAFLFQFREHTFLGVNASRLTHQKSFGQIL